MDFAHAEGLIFAAIVRNSGSITWELGMVTINVLHGPTIIRQDEPIYYQILDSAPLQTCWFGRSCFQVPMKSWITTGLLYQQVDEF